MKKETLLSYIDKGDINHNGYKINVTSEYLEKTKIHYLRIELKPINNYTESAFFSGSLESICEEDLENIENSFEKAYEQMRKQEQYNNIKPIKLVQINNLSDNYIATFKDENKNKYVLIDSATEGKVELCTFHIEPECDVKIPIEIKGQVINPKYSFWLSSCIYNAEDFNKVLEEEREYIDEEESETL